MTACNKTQALINMKYIKLCSVLFTITLLTTASNCLNTHNDQNGVYALKTNKTIVKQEKQNSKTETKEAETQKLLANKKPDIATDKVLSDEDLKLLFPDANFRDVITRNFKHQEITLDKIAALSGEFYATGEGIESLEGISYLKNIQNFVFVNNDIKELPSEILNLKNIKNINLLNNYITDNSVLNKLIKKGIKVNYNLNFIKNKDNQYKFYSVYKNLDLKKGEKVSLDKLLCKEIKNKDYEKYWEVTDEMSTNIKYVVSIYDNKVLNLEEGNKIKAISPGECKVKVSIDDNFYDDSTTTINVKVK